MVAPADDRPSAPSAGGDRGFVVAVDHVSFTVPDLDEAVDFFETALGASVVYRRRRRGGADERRMVERFAAHPSTAYELAMLRCAGGFHVELFAFESPDQNRVAPRNVDVGGHHLALLVDDVDAAVKRLRARGGIRFLGEPETSPPDHPAAGARWVYLVAPWGQQFELVSRVTPLEDAGRAARTLTV